jgi:ribonuclease P protein component
MTRSTDFGLTVNRGIRAAQPNLVVHALRSDGEHSEAPKVGLVVSKAVGNAVVRHRVSRRLRHVARDFLHDLAPGDRVVIRALPKSARADSTRLRRELATALERTRR